MPFTTGSDLNFLTAADSTNVGAGAGNDKYVIAGGSNFAANQVINISDTQGTNTLQLIGGLTITSSKVSATALQLTLSNGATINLVGANAFSFEIGGDPLAGTAGVVRTFDAFVTNVLGTTTPTGSTVSNGASGIVVSSNGSTVSSGVPAPTPTPTPTPTPGNTTINLSAGADTVAYNDNANLTVNGLGGSDTVTINGSGNNTFNNLVGTGNANTITITGNGSNSVNTGDGADTATISGSGSSTISAGDGANTVDLGGVTGFSTVLTGTGSDTITAGSGGSNINAGAGDDTIYCGAGVDTIKFMAGTVWSGATSISPVGLDSITKFTGGGTDVLAFSASTFHGMNFGGPGAISGTHIGVFTGTSQLLNSNLPGNQSLAGGVTTITQGAILLVGTNSPTNIVDVYVADGAAVAGNAISTEVAAGHVILVGHVTIAGAALTAADFSSIG